MLWHYSDGESPTRAKTAMFYQYVALYIENGWSVWSTFLRCSKITAAKRRAASVYDADRHWTKDHASVTASLDKYAEENTT